MTKGSIKLMLKVIWTTEGTKAGWREDFVTILTELVCMKSVLLPKEIMTETVWEPLLHRKKSGNTHLFIFFALYFQSATATRWAPSTTAATPRVSAIAGTAQQGPSAMTVCRATTGSRAVTVSSRPLIFKRSGAGGGDIDKCCSLSGPLWAHGVI